MTVFYNRGAVPNKSLSYIHRDFEAEVFSRVVGGNWVLLLGPRQHGKTSGLVRLQQMFNEAGFTVGLADLQALPPCGEFSELLEHVARQISETTHFISESLPSGLDRNELVEWLDAIFPPSEQPIVVFIDEAGSISNDSFLNSFYGQIRSISSLRAQNSRFHTVSRISFVFTGTFRPETLVHDKNSPFNICDRVESTDLTLFQVEELVENVDNKVKPIISDVYSYLGGQPFLIQTAFKEVVISGTNDVNAAWEKVKQDFPYLVSDHLEGIFSKIITDDSLCQKIGTMLTSGFIDIVPGDPEFNYLIVLGIAQRQGHRIVFRNDFYKDIALKRPEFVTKEVVAEPDSLSSNPVTAYKMDIDTLKFMQSPNLQQIALSAYNGAVTSHNNGHYRLALTGFGSSIEAVLIDLLQGLSTTDFQQAVNDAKATRDAGEKPSFTNHEDEAKPESWRLVNLIRVAKRVKVRSGVPSEPSHAIRDWRNLVHPAIAVTNYVDESMLVIESNMALMMFSALLRDITK